MVKELAGRLIDQVRIMEAQPVLKIRVRYLDIEDIAFFTDIRGRLKPGFKSVIFNPALLSQPVSDSRD